MLLSKDEAFQAFYVPVIKWMVANDVPFEVMVREARNLEKRSEYIGKQL